MSDLLRVKTSFLWGTQFFHKGTILSADDPAVAGREVLFEAVAPARTVPVAPVVEQATAAPGERRTTTRKAKG